MFEKFNTLRDRSNIVYILINESMPEMVKIGITDNLERRIKELKWSHISPSFRSNVFMQLKLRKMQKK